MLEVHGGTPLAGRVRVRGAKNLVSKAMVASLLGDTPSVLRGVPRIRDVEVVTGLLDVHGVSVSAGPDSGLPDGELTFDPAGASQGSIVDIDAHAGASRIPILFCGPPVSYTHLTLPTKA